MSIRNLDALFHPRSVALIGARDAPGTAGAVLARNLFRGGFDGPIMPVNATRAHIQSVRAYAAVDDLPEAPDLAVLADPDPEALPGLIDRLGGIGSRAVILAGTSLGETGTGDDPELKRGVLDAARPHLLRVLGPRSLGLMAPGAGLNASFAGTEPIAGRLAFVSQSSTVMASVIDWATARGFGFSHVVSLGGMWDVDFGDLLDYLASHDHCRAILLYVERIGEARKFMSAARAAARSKPVIVMRSGRHLARARQGRFHSGALAQTDLIYDAAFRRAGMLRVCSLDELFDAVGTLGLIGPPRGDGLAIIGNGGGMGILATDLLISQGGRLAHLSDETRATLSHLLGWRWSESNPITITGAETPYGQVVEILDRDPDVHAILVIHSPSVLASAEAAAQDLTETLARRPHDRPTPIVLTCWTGEGRSNPVRGLFQERGIPSYQTPDQAVRAVLQLVNYRRNQETLMETPPSVAEDFSPDTEAARRLLGQARESGGDWLMGPEAKAVLAAYGIPASHPKVAESADDAARLAAGMDGPLVLKILSPQITHKTEVGGVATDLRDPESVRAAALAMVTRMEQARPEATLRGFTLEPMIRRPGAHEVMIGLSIDSLFGPVILFGQGGTAVELFDDMALALPPLNMHLARETIARTRIHRLLKGYRGLPPVDLDAMALTLIKLSQMAIDLPEIVELDINPLLAGPDGVTALDARIRVAAGDRGRADRLAIRPYPKALEEMITLTDGRQLLLRPVVPEDEPPLRRTVAGLSPQEARLRFLAPIKELSHVQAARFTQIDYDREMALILTDPGRPGTTEIHGVVRIHADPDNDRAEYAILVRRELGGQGLGVGLMRRIIDYARNRGIGEIYGDVLRENERMLGLCKELGFTRKPSPEGGGIVRVTLKL